MAATRGDGPAIRRGTNHKLSAQGWHCSKCGKQGTFRLNTLRAPSLNDFMTLLAESHREVLRQSAIVVRCGAEPGHGSDGFLQDTDGYIWCGDFVIGAKKRPWLQMLKSKLIAEGDA